LTPCSALHPFRPCFVPVTPVGFGCFQRFSPALDGPHLSVWPPLHAVSKAASQAMQQCAAPRVCASSGSVAHRRRCYPTAALDPLLALLPYEVLVSMTSAPCFHGASSHGLRRADPPGEPSGATRLLFRVSENPRDDPTTWAESPSMGFVPVPANTPGKP
jgi:hypothetical protein